MVYLLQRFQKVQVFVVIIKFLLLNNLLLNCLIKQFN